MAKKSNKIPGAAVAIAVVLLIGIVFIPTVYMPYKNKKPQMDADHEAALEEIQMYEDAIADQKNIEANIADLQEQWDEFRKTMFIDANSSLQDIEAKIRDTDFYLQTFTKAAGVPDGNGAVSFTGSPLYYQTIAITGYGSQETLLEILKYIEEESVGCYYVKSLQAATLESDISLGDKYNFKEGDLQVTMQIYLYYYNEAERVEPVATEETDTAS